MSLVPTMANALLKCPDLGKYDISSLKRDSCRGCGRLAGTDRSAGTRFPDATCMAGYGLTETCPVASDRPQKGTVVYAR